MKKMFDFHVDQIILSFLSMEMGAVCQEFFWVETTSSDPFPNFFFFFEFVAISSEIHCLAPGIPYASMI